MDLTTEELQYLLEYSMQRRFEAKTHLTVHNEDQQLTKMLGTCMLISDTTVEGLRVLAATLSLNPEVYDEFVEIANEITVPVDVRESSVDSINEGSPDNDLYDVLLEADDVYVTTYDHDPEKMSQAADQDNTVVVITSPVDQIKQEHLPMLEESFDGYSETEKVAGVLRTVVADFADTLGV